MVLTIFGFIIAIVGLFLLFRGSVMDMLLLVMACTLLGGSAAAILVAIGGSSVPPAQFALIFAVLRLALPGNQRWPQTSTAIKVNGFLGIYALYGIIAAAFAPAFFRNTIQVVPMRPTGVTSYIFATAPLAPSPQNLTAAVYITGSFLAGIVAFVAMQERGSPQRFVKMGVIIAWVHVALGVLAALLKGTPFDLFVDFMRNANYAQLDQSMEGMVRITGIFPEPSAYAGFGFAWFVFLLECWFRDILARRTGPPALALGLVLCFSTSSTAYVGLGIYGSIVVLRILAAPQHLSARKGMAISALALLAVIVVCAVAFLMPPFLDLMSNILSNATVNKQHSASGLQRAFWAKIGLKAFVHSYGFGIGPGSSRSSSFVTAMLGAMGVIGSLAFAAHMLRAFKPVRISTYCGPKLGSQFGENAMIGVAAGWAALGIMIPAAVSSSTCDPGGDFAVFAAVALALRRKASAVPNRQSPAANWHPLERAF